MLAAGTAFALYYTGAYPEPLEAFRTAFFAVASTASTTGYASADWSNWPYGIPFILLLSSAVVSCAGSTGAASRCYESRSFSVSFDMNLQGFFIQMLLRQSL